MDKVKDILSKSSSFIQSHKILSLVVGMGFVIACSIVVMILVLKKRALSPPNNSNQPPPPPPSRPLPPGNLMDLDVSVKSE